VNKQKHQKSSLFFFQKAINTKTEDELFELLQQYKIKDKHELIDKYGEELKSWVLENALKIKFPDNFNTPLLNLKKPFVDLLTIIADAEIKNYISNKDIQGFLVTLNHFGKNATKFLRVASNQNVLTDPIKNARELTNLFFKQRVDTCKFAEYEIELVRMDGKLLFDCLDAYADVALDNPSFQYSQRILGNTFNKRIAIALAANIINLDDWVKLHKMYLENLLNSAFGQKSADPLIKDKLAIFSEAFNKASKQLKEAFLYLSKIGIAEIRSEYTLIDTWFNSIKLFETSSFGGGIKIPDLSKSTNKDLFDVDKRIREEIAPKSLAIIILNFMGFVKLKTEIGTEYNLWREKTFEIIYRLLEDGYIQDRSLLFEMMTDEEISKKALPLIEKSNRIIR
jgi:hypothetical protein